MGVQGLQDNPEVAELEALGEAVAAGSHPHAGGAAGVHSPALGRPLSQYSAGEDPRDKLAPGPPKVQEICRQVRESVMAFREGQCSRTRRRWVKGGAARSLMRT